LTVLEQVIWQLRS